MSAWKALLAGAAIGVILIAFWDPENGRWMAPAGFGDRRSPLGEDELEEEPLLGYDGMDEETLIDWLEESELDGEMLMRTRWYEQRHLAREPVLDALDSRL